MTNGGTTEHEMQTTYAFLPSSPQTARVAARTSNVKQPPPTCIDPKLISTGTPDRRREQTSEQ